MYTYADEEANISLVLDVPSSIQLLVFGGLPRNNSLNDVVHDEATSPNYFYMTDEGSIISGHAQVRFCGENDSCCATFLPGRYHVTLHLLMTPGGPYVAITT